MMASSGMVGESIKTEREKFKKQEYWEERYKTEESFDWFCELSSFEHLLTPHLNCTDRILNLGCGNSKLTFSLYERGYRNIDSIDFSATVIERMKERSLDLSMPSLRWHVMDMLDLGFDRESFDVVLDKGSLDALMVDQEDVWNPKQEVIEQVEKALNEAFRVLKTGGHLISVTFSQPHFRGPLLYQPEKFLWNLRHWHFGETFHYYFFVATKKSNLETVLKDQDFDYSYPSIYGRTSESCCAGGTKAVLRYDDLEDENYLMKIGDV